MHKVSVVIPTYNRSKLLHTAITSVINQTYPVYEIIVVDDASTDNTREVVSAFSEKKIKYIYHDKNVGEAGARNTGILNTSGDYIAFLDDDDKWLPDKIQLQVTLLDKSPSQIGIIYTGWHCEDMATRRIVNRIIPAKRGNIYRALLARNIILTPSTVILRRQCLEAAGLFDENICYGTDYDLWLRISRYFDFECIEKPLVIYRMHEKSMTNDYNKVIKGYDALLNKYPGLLNRKKYSNKYFSCGVNMCLSGNMKNGIRALAKSLKLTPFKIQIYPYIFSAFLGEYYFKRYMRLKIFLKNYVFNQANQQGEDLDKRHA